MPVPEAGVKLAVKIMDWPKAEGLADELTVTPATALETVCIKNGDVDAALLTSPL